MFAKRACRYLDLVFERRGVEGDCMCLASGLVVSYASLRAVFIADSHEGMSREKGRLKETGNGERTGKGCPRGTLVFSRKPESKQSPDRRVARPTLTLHKP